jgi:hypothetical protein
MDLTWHTTGQTRSTSKVRLFDFGGCKPLQQPKVRPKVTAKLPFAD